MHQQAVENKLYLAETRFLYHCNIKIKVPIETRPEVLEQCFNILETIDYQYNIYSTNSYFSQMNQNFGNWVEVDVTTITLLKQIQFWSAFFDNNFDPTIAPLLKIWGLDTEIFLFPSEEEIKKTLPFVDCQKIEISENKIRIPQGMKFHTGAFIKAFAVDSVIKFLKQNHITDALINAGGSSIYALNNENHPYWEINVFDNNKRLFSLKLSNACYSTSARKNADGSQNFSHIINPQTGYPSKNHQVGIITESAFLGDIFSTALFSAKAEEFDYFIKKLQKNLPTEAFLLNENKEISYSDNFINYLKTTI